MVITWSVRCSKSEASSGAPALARHPQLPPGLIGKRALAAAARRREPGARTHASEIRRFDSGSAYRPARRKDEAVGSDRCRRPGGRCVWEPGARRARRGVLLQRRSAGGAGGARDRPEGAPPSSCCGRQRVRRLAPTAPKRPPPSSERQRKQGEVHSAVRRSASSSTAPTPADLAAFRSSMHRIRLCAERAGAAWLRSTLQSRTSGAVLSVQLHAVLRCC